MVRRRVKGRENNVINWLHHKYETELTFVREFTFLTIKKLLKIIVSCYSTLHITQTYHSNLKDYVMYAPLTFTRPGAQKCISKVTIIGFRRAKSLKEILVRAKVPPVKKNRGFLRLCKKLRCEICEYIGSTDSFKSTTTQWTYLIRRDNLKYSAGN